MLTPSSLKNEFALITGASTGLGLEFASQLSSLGMNLVLVARSQKALEEASRSLRKDPKQKIVLIPQDLTDSGAVETIVQTLHQNGVKIKVLVNNAGSGSWGLFENTAPETYSKMIDLNVKVPVLLSRQLFDDLRSFEDSAVINVSSLAAVHPIPFMSTYAATKSFLTHFGVGLWHEWEKHGIHVQTLMPGAIDTDFDKKHGGFEAPFKKDRTQDIVKLSLDALFKTKNPIVYAKGSFSQRLFEKVLPLPLLIREVGKVFSPKRK